MARHLDRNDVFPETLWKNPGPYEDSSLFNHKIFTKLIKASFIFIQSCKDQIIDNGILIKLRQQRRFFDIGTLEQYDFCAFGLFRLLNITKILWLSGTGIYRGQTAAIGIDYPISFVPELLLDLTDNMSFIDRLKNLFITKALAIVYRSQRNIEQILYKRYYQQKAVNFKESKYIYYIVANSVPLLDFAAPTSQQIIPIAGFIHSDQQPLNINLSQRWKTLADRSVDGFILIAFGSIAKFSDMSQKMQHIFLNACRLFPKITFIVKYDKTVTNTSNLSENIYFANWIPQQSLMMHPKFRTIITHGGLGTIFEAIISGRPMILIPLFGDHCRNARLIQKRQLGVVLDKSSLTTDQLYWSIKKVLSSTLYVNNINKQKLMIEDWIRLVNLSSYVDRLLKFSTALSKFKLRQMELDFLQRNHAYVLICAIIAAISLLAIE
uniref:glucuronosyltransferase n=1 Tax=Syphacia muris TaxID=451379 RepID=A0A0N5AWV7_9BILA